MKQVCWQADASGRYVIDVVLGGLDVRVMVDSGLVDPLDEIGFEVEPAIFDLLERTGALGTRRHRRFRTASGAYTNSPCAEVAAQLRDPISHHLVGPIVRVYLSRGVPRVPNRVGVVYFHRLVGCRLLWDLGGQAWCIEYP